MAEDRRSPDERSRDPQIGELLAKGWAIILRHNVTATTVAAEDYFSEVLRRDPDNLSATIGLGAHYVISVSNLYVRDTERYLSRADELLATEHAAAIRELLALRIIEMARLGEREPNQLRADAVLYLARTNMKSTGP